MKFLLTSLVKFCNLHIVNPTLHMFAAFALAFALVMFAMPPLIRVALLKRLVDEPEEGRKMHTTPVPTIGGVAVFLGFLVACLMWLPHAFSSLEVAHNWGAALAALVILFFMGVKDDLAGLSPSKKLLIHFLLGGLLIFEGQFRIEGFAGLFGLHDIPYFVSAGFSLFVYIVVVNAINLIDGVDGLAGGFGVIASVAFGLLFAAAGAYPPATVAFALAGALAGFLKFNWTPARIFLGDGGSLLTGLVFYVLCVEWMNTPLTDVPEYIRAIPQPLMSMSLLAYPLVDTLRVFTLRVLKGRSPFSPDRNHLHHRMMALRWGHRRTSTTVYLYTGIMMLLPFLLFTTLDWNPTVLFLIELGVAFGLFIPILRRSLAVIAERSERLEKERHKTNSEKKAHSAALHVSK